MHSSVHRAHDTTSGLSSTLLIEFGEALMVITTILKALANNRNNSVMCGLKDMDGSLLLAVVDLPSHEGGGRVIMKTGTMAEEATPLNSRAGAPFRKNS